MILSLSNENFLGPRGERGREGSPGPPVRDKNLTKNYSDLIKRLSRELEEMTELKGPRG